MHVINEHHIHISENAYGLKIPCVMAYFNNPQNIS